MATDQPAPTPQRRVVLVSITPDVSYGRTDTYQLLLVGPGGRFWTGALQGVPASLTMFPDETDPPPPSAVVFLTTQAAAIAAGIDR